MITPIFIPVEDAGLCGGPPSGPPKLSWWFWVFFVVALVITCLKMPVIGHSFGTVVCSYVLKVCIAVMVGFIGEMVGILFDSSER